MVVRWAGLSISETTDLHGFLYTTVSSVYTESYEENNSSNDKKNKRSECQLGEKPSHQRRDQRRDQRRMATLVLAERKGIVTQITIVRRKASQDVQHIEP